jgi:putative intracellular protease/amidase
MSANVNVTKSTPRKVLMVVANPSVSATTGWPVGFWASELTHPWYEFTEVGYEVTLASPDGGKVELDAMSDPRDPSGYSANDVISMGFLSTPELVAMLEETKKLSDLDLDEFDAIVVCGGQSPMFTFRDNEDLKQAISHFYESERPTAALCHGTAALMDVKLSDGSYLIEGKTMTGFADVEEEAADAAAGQKVMPWHIEEAAKERGANYIEGGLWRAFAVRDGSLITGQQQYSGREVAKLVIEALGT